MPVTKTAKRALRNSRRKRTRNINILKNIDILKRIFKKNPSAKSFGRLVSEVDKATKKNLIHKNKASRIKSRLSRLINKKKQKSKE